MAVFRFGTYELRAATRQLIDGQAPVKIGARAFDVLRCLVENRDAVVGRDDVMTRVWPDTVVGENNLNVQVANLRRILGPGAIVTVAGRGLKFALDVTAEQAGPPQDADRPSVAVLPFALHSSLADTEWLADGYVDDITTELSRFQDLFVVARNSAFRFRETPRDLADVSQRLGVRYVVEGSVRASDGRVRVCAQLIDAQSGAQVWAENFVSALDDHFDMEHRIAHALVTCLAPQIERAEMMRVRAQPPQNLTAHGLAQRAWSVVSAGDMAYDPAPRIEALRVAHQALGIDPRSALAWRSVAWIHWWDAYHGTAAFAPDTVADGIIAADKAICIDPIDHHARRLKALLLVMCQKPVPALLELRRAREINPNCAITLAWSGLYETMHGDIALGMPFSDAALQHSPLDPSRGSMLVMRGFAQFALRDYDNAVETAEQSLAEAAQAATPLVLMTIALVGAGHFDRARATFDRLAALAPRLVEARLSGIWLSSNPDYLRRANTCFRIAAGVAEAADAALLLRRD